MKLFSGVLLAVSFLMFGVISAIAAPSADEICSQWASDEGKEVDVVCSCVVDALEDDETLHEEYLSLGTGANFETLSDELKESIGSCADS